MRWQETGLRGELPRSAGKDVADETAVGQLRGDFNRSGFTVTIRVWGE